MQPNHMPRRNGFIGGSDAHHRRAQKLPVRATTRKNARP